MMWSNSSARLSRYTYCLGVGKVFLPSVFLLGLQSQRSAAGKQALHLSNGIQDLLNGKVLQQLSTMRFYLMERGSCLQEPISKWTWNFSIYLQPECGRIGRCLSLILLPDACCVSNRRRLLVAGGQTVAFQAERVS